MNKEADKLYEKYKSEFKSFGFNQIELDLAMSILTDLTLDHPYFKDGHELLSYIKDEERFKSIIKQMTCLIVAEAGVDDNPLDLVLDYLSDTYELLEGNDLKRQQGALI